DPGVAPNLNPGSRTTGAQQASAGAPRTAPPPAAGNTLGVLTDAATGRDGRTLGTSVDGGAAHDNGDPLHGTVPNVGSVSGHVVYTDVQIANYSSRSPAVAAAQADFVRARQTADQAHARATALAAQSEAAKNDPVASQRIQIEIANNSQ